jgi:pyrroloquinoline quinone biosynthesis protein D
VRTPALAAGVRFRRAADGSAVLLIPEGVVSLNGSAAAVMELVDGRRTVGEIAEDLTRRYAADPAQMQADVAELLAQMTSKMWVVWAPENERQP